MSYVDISKYRVNEPYPIVNIPRENRLFAALLQDDYAGIVSEYTSISQFIYAYIISDEIELSDDFYGIAMVEMTHLDLIADIIKQLGGNPVFTSGNGMVWNSNVLAYGNSTKNRLRLCLKIKQRSLDQYKSHISRIDDPDIRDLLQRITLDEELHIQILKGHLDRFKSKHEDNYYNSKRNNDEYDDNYDNKYDDYNNNSYTTDSEQDYNDVNGTNDSNQDNDTNTSQTNVQDNINDYDYDYDYKRDSRHSRHNRRRNRHNDAF